MKAGRPPKYKNPITFSITIDKNLRSILTSYANRESKTISDIANESFKLWLAKENEIIDLREVKGNTENEDNISNKETIAIPNSEVGIKTLCFSYLCLRCNHQWHPHITELPKYCPKCSSKYWNRLRQKRKWTQEENQVVRDLYDGTKASMVKISRQLGIPFETVRAKLSTMKILVWIRSRYWTKEEEKYLIENFGKTESNVMEEYLNRSQKAIEVQASRLGVRGKHDGYNALGVSKILGLSVTTICRYLQMEIIKGIRLPLYSGSTPHEWQISKLNIIHFMKSNFLLYEPESINIEWQKYIPFEEIKKWVSVGEASREFNLSMQWFYERIWGRAMLARKGIGRKHHGLVAYVFRPDIEETLKLGGQYLPKYKTPDIPYQKGSMRGKLVPHVYKYICPTCGNGSDIGGIICPKCQLDELKLISRDGSVGLLLKDKDTNEDTQFKRLEYEKTKRLKEQHPCIDCGKPCNKNSTRCKPCHTKYRKQIHEGFKHTPIAQLEQEQVVASH